MLFCSNNININIEKIKNLPTNTKSDCIYDFQNYQFENQHEILHIKISNGFSCDELFLFCDICSNFEYCTILNGNQLYIIKFNTIYKIDVITKQVKFVDIDDLAGALGLHKVKDGLIVHGELKIVKLDFELNEIWHFSGADIFASLLGKPTIQIYDDRIELLDFENNHYVISHNGKLIKQDKL